MPTPSDVLAVALRWRRLEPVRGAGQLSQPSPVEVGSGSSASGIVRAISAAATCTAESIACAARRQPEDVRRQLAPAVRWLVSRVTCPRGDPAIEEPPLIARDYVDRLRGNLVRELAAATESLSAREVVATMGLLEELAESWRKTDRGSFMARLTGSESASALVAIAHDIRSPLSSILILVDSLRRRHGAWGEIHERQLGLIYGATQGLATLASDLMDAARGEELLSAAPMPFSIAETMRSVAAIVQPIAEEKGLELMITPPATDARVGHATSLHRVLLNLASNALRYTDSGTVTLGCRETSPDTLRFWVHDTGKGLPPNVRATLFDAFRPEETSLRFSSSGLGLATVRALLAALDSDLRVQTAEGQGTLMSFDLVMPPSPRD